MSPITAETLTASTGTDLHHTLATAGRACCCPARPVVLVIIPAAADRPNAADLLLCGHHYRISAAALDAIGAIVLNSRETDTGDIR